MGSVKKSTIVTFVLFLIPITVSVISAVKFSIPLMVITVVLDFLATGVNPFARRRQCLYLFVLVIFTASPIFFAIIKLLIRWELIESPIILISIFVFSIMLSVTEIILELICRLIWKKQYKLSLYETN